MNSDVSLDSLVIDRGGDITKGALPKNMAKSQGEETRSHVFAH